MPPDQRVGVLKARGEYADPHFAGTAVGIGDVDHLQLLGTAEAPELNNAVARFDHTRKSCISYSKERTSRFAAGRRQSIYAWKLGPVIDADQFR